MPNERLAVAHDIVRHLNEAERVNDLALTATARLAIAMLEGRIKLNAAAEVGQDAFAAVASTFHQQSAGRHQLVAAHAALAEARDRMGLRAEDVGGMGDKKVPQYTGALAIVKRNAA